MSFLIELPHRSWCPLILTATNDTDQDLQSHSGGSGWERSLGRVLVTLSWWFKLLVLCFGHLEEGPWAGFSSNPQITSRIRKVGGAKVGAAEELKFGQAGQAAACAPLKPHRRPTGPAQERRGEWAEPEVPFLKLYLLSHASGSRSECLHPCRPPPAINLMALSLKAA